MVDVCIIGLGPVGAALANLLGMAGRRVLVLEREAAAYHLPRAVHFDEEVMRLFETMGLAEAIVQHTHVSPGMRFVDAEGRVLLEWPHILGAARDGGELARLLDQISRPMAAKGAGRECSASSADPSALSACTTPEHDDR